MTCFVLAVLPAYATLVVAAAIATAACAVLAGVWLVLEPSRHRRTKLALLGAELVVLAALVWIDIEADAAVRGHARRLACAARLQRLASHLALARRLDMRTPKDYPVALAELAVVPDFGPEDAICPMDGQPYAYRVDAGGAWVEGRAPAALPLLPERGHHVLRVTPEGFRLEWVVDPR